MAESELPDNGPGAATAIAMLDPAAGHCLRRRWWLLPASGRRGAAQRFIDFFTANIRNPNTGELGAIRTHHAWTYIEALT
jgi:hypothetical protein